MGLLNDLFNSLKGKAQNIPDPVEVEVPIANPDPTPAAPDPAPVELPKVDPPTVDRQIFATLQYQTP